MTHAQPVAPARNSAAAWTKGRLAAHAFFYAAIGFAAAFVFGLIG